MDSRWKILECPICIEEQEEPKLLHCGHSFCKACLGDLLKSKGQLICPLCRDITGMELDSLPRNIYFYELKALYAIPVLEQLTSETELYEMQENSQKSMEIATEQQSEMLQLLDDIERSAQEVIQTQRNRVEASFGPTRKFHEERKLWAAEMVQARLTAAVASRGSGTAAPLQKPRAPPEPPASLAEPLVLRKDSRALAEKLTSEFSRRLALLIAPASKVRIKLPTQPPQSPPMSSPEPPRPATAVGDPPQQIRSTRQRRPVNIDASRDPNRIHEDGQQPNDSWHPRHQDENRHPQQPNDSRYPRHQSENRHPQQPNDSRHPRHQDENRHPQQPNRNGHPEPPNPAAASSRTAGTGEPRWWARAQSAHPGQSVNSEYEVRHRLDARLRPEGGQISSRAPPARPQLPRLPPLPGNWPLRTLPPIGNEVKADKQTDKQTDRQTDRQEQSNVPHQLGGQ